MPDSTRPKSSMFFQVVKGFMTFDGSLKRIIAHPGGKNFDTIFAYITSKNFESLMLTKNKSGKIGKDVFNEEWLTPKEFLRRMEWPETSENEVLVLSCFHSYTQDKAMKSRWKGDSWQFEYKSELDFPDHTQMNKARSTNKYIMDVIDDLMDFLHPSLESGRPTHDRTQSIYAPLWEALLSDPLIGAFQDEMVHQAVENLPEETSKVFKILQFGTGAGAGTISLIDQIYEVIADAEIKIIGIEEIPALASKSRDLVSHKLVEDKSKLSQKNLRISFQVETQMFQHFDIAEKNFDLIVGLQILNNIRQREIIGFFDRISKYISESGTMIMGQSTSYSKEFPYPMTLMYLPIQGFQQFPTKDEIKSAVKDFFGSVKSSGLDAIWVLKDPKKY